MFKYVDLFSGIGSFGFSFSKLGFDCVMACDIDNPARVNYKNNHGIDALGDICDIDPTTIEPYEILCAGLPCQPFSQMGHHQGFEDSRGTMFSQVMRFVNINKPKVVLLENVPALLSHDDGKSFTKIREELENEGYTVVYKILKASDYGIPQNRRRLFIVGVKNPKIGIDKFFDLDVYKNTTTLSDYLGRNFEKDNAYTLRVGGRGSGINSRHNWDTYIVDGEEYRLTIDDGLKLQGFTDYKLTGTQTDRWRLIGNSIPTNFTHIIGKQIINLVR
tara:strand:- start:25 stop:849 length:825 start_codon:yes stop_codon:yes gene_type:complete